LIPLIVSDAGPLIALSRIERLALLEHLFESVVVPHSVLRELRLDEPRPGVVLLATAARDQRWLRHMDPPNNGVITGLDVGESEAIHLAQHLQCPLLIDERRGRANARSRGIPVIGIGRILIAAKETGLIESVSVALTALRGAGYRLSARICARLLTIVDETEPQP
jgi:hypothetical protein